MPNLHAVADATADSTARAARSVRDALDEAGEAGQAAVDEATSILDQVAGSAGRLGQILRSARTSAGNASENTAESIRLSRDRARKSAKLARSKAQEAASIGDRTIRTAAATLEEAGSNVDRARQVFGDAIGGSAAERLRGRRTSRRMRVGLLVGGAAGGAAATYFLDSDRGADRRKVALDQLRRWSQTASDAFAQTSRDLRVRLESRAMSSDATSYGGQATGGAVSPGAGAWTPGATPGGASPGSRWSESSASAREPVEEADEQPTPLA